MSIKDKAIYRGRQLKSSAKRKARKLGSLNRHGKVSGLAKVVAGGYGASVALRVNSHIKKAEKATGVSAKIFVKKTGKTIIGSAGTRALVGGTIGAFGAASVLAGAKTVSMAMATDSRGYKKDAARADKAYRREVASAKRRYKFTAARKAALKKAQRASARARKALGL